ncbi:hypothetical protein DICPUDRAFT_96364 [Dictyostelium purpureum]|uniref:Phospholipase B-like n=1 Tax=Dictyostelium purpureum TaxID=5786 RepID=F0Z7L0_DICPU|nr:uncharacterized protein DICPUDRAFT_96364 [Dictyostelium purpureum]EGC40035.1 hypothetical protein DICPUDRAFT_96364 [Dictyostelium purpureum]|eukprot:XP_003283384.1 hypothetical protein DICPUDRAFT_96364 [Dictyostelium purpureum]
MINNNKNQKQLTCKEYSTKYQRPTSPVPTFSVKLSSTNEYSVYSGNDSASIAQAAYSNEMMNMGWAYLSITTNSQFEDSIQAEAAGYIEGYLSYEMIWQTWYNIMVNEYNNKTIPSEIINFQSENFLYMKDNIYANANDPYWVHIGLVWSQLSGMVKGYNDANQDPDRQLSFTEFALINMDADLGDIVQALNISDAKESKRMDHIKKTDHCSGLIKLTDDLTELYSAHTSWSSYVNMLRIFKSYNFKFSTPAKSQLTIFSGYPATLASLDDFYLLDTRLVVLETTNGLNNNDLYYLINPRTVLTWMRVIIANRLANNGLTWCETFERENSGTYNNQWMIVDYKKFVPGVKVRDGTLYVLEQIPGYIEYADTTNVLRTGYFGSYNLPYFENVFNKSGFNDEGSSSGYEAYEEDVRSQIFRRDANKVYTLSDFQAIMRYNDFQNDPLAKGDAAQQVCSRFDLNPPTAEDYDAFGGVDSKVTSLDLVNQQLVIAQSGPTHDQEPAFRWSSGNWTSLYPTIGMPDLYNFTWVTFSDTSYSINE